MADLNLNYGSGFARLEQHPLTVRPAVGHLPPSWRAALAVEKRKTRTAPTDALSTMNLEHRSGSPSFSNPAKTRAEFTYSMVLNRIKIVDLNRGTASVTNDIENVLRKIEAWHQGSVPPSPVQDFGDCCL